MPRDDYLDQIVRLFVDAFDVDMQLFAARAMSQLRNTAYGNQLAEWAQTHPVQFEARLRAASVAAQRQPGNRGVVTDAVRDQLARLPVEIRRVFLTGDGAPPDAVAAPSVASSSSESAESFRARFEHAVEGMTDAELAIVARLTAAQKRELVDAPARLRPHLLTKFAEQTTLGLKLAKLGDDIDKDLEASGLTKWSKDLRERARRGAMAGTTSIAAKAVLRTGRLFGSSYQVRVTTPVLELKEPAGNLSLDTKTICRVDVFSGNRLSLTLLDGRRVTGEAITKEIECEFTGGASIANPIRLSSIASVYGTE